MMETDGVQSSSFFKARITLISKSVKSIINVIIASINKTKQTKKKHGFFIRCRKAFGKIQHPFMIKTQQTRDRG